MKKLIVLLTLFITTGCTVNYNLDIEDEILKETTTFTQEENSFYTKEYMNALYKEEYPIYYDEEFLYYSPEDKIEGNTYYEKSIKENSHSYIATYKATYDFDDFKKAQLLNNAYEDFNIGYDNKDGYYYIIASNFKLFKKNKYLTNVTINIDLKDYIAIESNSNSKNGTKYTWNLNKNSSNSIFLKYKKNINNDNENNIQSTPNNNNINNNKTMLDSYAIYIFLAILALIIYFGYKWFINMKDKNNDID